MDLPLQNLNSSSKNQEIVSVIERMIGKETEKAVESLGEKRWAHIKNYPNPPIRIKELMFWLYYLVNLSIDDPADNKKTIKEIINEIYLADVRSSLMSRWHKFKDGLIDFSSRTMPCLSVDQIERILSSFKNEFGDLNLESVKNTAQKVVPLWKVLESYMIALDKLRNTRISREILDSNANLQTEDTPINQRLNAAMEHPILLEAVQSAEKSPNR